MIMKKSDPAAVKDKAAKRSVLGILFNPQLGPALTPFRDSTRIFLHLLASVFSLYGLYPKNDPALRDPNSSLSLFKIMGAAWDSLTFDRDGLPRILIFFGVLGAMFISGATAFFAFVSLFVGQAHAQVTSFQAPAMDTSDLATSWIQYMFMGTSTQFPTFNDSYDSTTSAVMESPFGSSGGLQTAFQGALGFYSSAILIVAGLILFYHLTAMIVETAHHGVPMGKRASQIWAPIRLVIAIGMLVPTSSGLNCGQYVVIQMAQWGSNMASGAWDLFLGEFAYLSTQPVPPVGPMSNKAALDIIRMQACEIAWNEHIDEANASSTDVTAAYVPTSNPRGSPTGYPYVMGNITGTKYSFSSNTTADADVCGWYFIPDGGSNPLAKQAAGFQASAITNALNGGFATAAGDITNLISLTGAGQPAPPTSPQSITFNTHVKDGVAAYQADLNTQMAGLASDQTDAITTAIGIIRRYGWVMAGAFLNTIDRLQGTLISAAADSAPITSPPILEVATEKPDKGVWKNLWEWLLGSNTDASWNIRGMVTGDLQSFELYMHAAITDGQINSPSSQGVGTGSTNGDAQCAAMVGLTSGTAGGAGSDYGLGQVLFGIVDTVASWNKVWQNGTGTSCGAGTANPSATTFKLGVQINGRDPFAQMAFLGHSNLNVAFTLMSYSMAAGIAGETLGHLPSFLGTIGSLVGGPLKVMAGPMMFLALIFFACGFTLAYLLPLMPFMRFFFAVLGWVAAIIEAVVAIPLVALAHLNPEGEGLPGQSARNAYFFVFSLFLRPILVVFGLICGLMVFLIALSFLNYAYAVAVAGAGGTAYGHAVMSKVVYSVLYVAILYICANHSFQLIDHLPQHAMSWMGATGQAMPDMGKADHIERVGGLVSQYAGSQMTGQLTGVGNSAGGLLGGHLKEGKAEAKALRTFAKQEKLNNDRTDRMVASNEARGGGDTGPTGDRSSAAGQDSLKGAGAGNMPSGDTTPEAKFTAPGTPQSQVPKAGPVSIPGPTSVDGNPLT
jgi:conjugal transfer/type IV secretion protein DotA/TraY